MVQYYINSKPVPKAIARHWLESGLPNLSRDEVLSLMSQAFRKDANAVKVLANCGVEVFQIRG